MSQPARGKWMLVLAFLLTLAAGIVVGMGVSQRVNADPLPQPQPATRPDRSWLTSRLNLTDQQHEKMRAIWSKVMEGPGGSLYEERRGLYRQREAAVDALFTPDLLARREQVYNEFRVKLDANDRERDKYVQEAVAETKKILDPAQREEYEKMLAERDRNDHHRGPSSRPGGGPMPFGDGPKSFGDGRGPQPPPPGGFGGRSDGRKGDWNDRHETPPPTRPANPSE